MNPASDPGDETPPPYLQGAMWWLLAAGILLLLPRQWISALIVFALAGAIRVALALKRKAPPGPDRDAEDR